MSNGSHDNPFYQLTESSPDAIFVGLNGCFAYVNPAAMRLFGATEADELLGKPVIERIHPDHRDIVGQRIRALYDEKRSAPLLEEVYLRLDGSAVDVEVAAAPFHFQNQDGALVFVRNISERKRIENDLQQHQTLLQGVIDNSTAVIFVKDRDGRYLLINRRYSELFHIDNNAISGKSDYDLFTAEVADNLKAADREVLNAGRAKEYEELIPQDDGVHTYFSLKFPLFDNQGMIYAICGIATDITERIRAEEQVRALNQSLEQRVEERTHELQQSRTELESALTEFRSLAENVPDNVVRTDLQGRALFFNTSMKKMLGVDTDELLGKTPMESFPDGRFAKMHDALLRVGTSGKDEQFEIAMELPDGSRVVHAVNIAIEKNPEGEPVSVLAIGRDITGQRQAEEELRLAASVFHNSTEGVMICDAGGVILSVNPAFSEITGYSEEEALGNNPSMLRSDRHKREFYVQMWHQLAEEGVWQGEIWNRRRSGEVYLEWLSINRIDNSEGEADRYVAVFHDITETRRKDERIRHLAFHDPLTNLPNRTLFLDRLQHALDRARREKSGLSVTFIDLDRFKSINDSLGHDTGDLLLQKVADRISRQLRATDTVARLGGDEFVVLMEDLQESEHCALLAESLIEDIARPLELRGHRVEIGASMGMAFYPEDGDDPLELMKRADTAMYAAKTAGRNTYRFFQPQMLERTSQRLKMEMELRRAIANDDLELHYQPKVDLASGRPVGAEALIRWHHPQNGLISPDNFIPLAEECGLIREIGRWVIDASCHQMVAWKEQGLQLKLALNISAHQLTEGDLASLIEESVRRYDIPPTDLELELTESAVMERPEHVIALFDRLRAIGVSLAVDDFGTGYSSLAYLRRLPIDVLKIDRSFVRDANRNKEDAEIVKTILALGQTLNLTVVAEGIEEQAQASLLQEMGCHLAQGYHFSPPLPHNAFSEWWRQAQS